MSVLVRIDHSLEQLLEQAQMYGLVHLFQSDTDGGFRCIITFHTVKHIKLEAKSSYKVHAVKEALISAIEAAEEIQKQLPVGGSQCLGLKHS